MHPRRLAPAVLIAAVFAALTSQVGVADTTATWAGTVAYVNRTHIGVKADAQTKDFLLASDFDDVYAADGSRAKRSEIKVGTFVRLTYTRSTMFGATRVTRVDLGSGELPFSVPKASASP